MCASAPYFPSLLNKLVYCLVAAGGDQDSAAYVSSSKIDRLLKLLSEIQGHPPGTTASKRPTNAPSTVLASRNKSEARLAKQFRKLPDIESDFSPGGSPSAFGAGGGGAAAHSRSGAPRDKVIVFSQWTSMLDLLELPFKRLRYNYRRLDGTMTIAQRERAVADFEGRPEVFILLVSLKAAALGLNLVAANHVVLMDLWWNPTQEAQAIDRAHRMGQTREVSATWQPPGNPCLKDTAAGQTAHEYCIWHTLMSWRCKFK